MKTVNHSLPKRITFKQFCLLVFVLFSLYIMGDAFYRWDGFSYYASFMEFLPSVALAFFLWSILSVFISALLWVLFRIFEWFCNLKKIKISIEHILLFGGIFILSGTLVWKIKKLVWPHLQTTGFLKLAVFLSVSGASIVATWLLRNKAKRWSETAIERIIPLVWIFSICLVVSVPLVAYHTWFKGTDKTASMENRRSSSTDKVRPNVILITFDALTARNMSAYGYHRDTTPFIREWSENATVFTMVESSSNFTTPSAASLLTGKRVWTHQTYHIEGSKPLESKVESLPSILRNYGYFNAAFVVNPFASIRVLGMSDSFDIAPPTSEFGRPYSLFGWKFGIIDLMLYRMFGDKIRLHNWVLRNDFIISRIINLFSRNVTQTEAPPEKAFNTFLEHIDDNRPRPFFAWIHLFPPHDPYLPPRHLKGKFSDSDELRTYKQQEKLIEESYKYLFQYQRIPEEMEPSVGLMRDYYDEFITYIDEEFKNFIQELNKRKIDNTIIILTADHGESFTHGYLTHGGPFLYEQVTNVPLIIKEPAQERGKTVDALVEQIDIPATVLDLGKVPVPAWMEGRSLVPLIRGEGLPPRHAFSMNFEENRSRGHQINRGSIAVWEGDYKLIHYLEKNESLLFNLTRDPDEKENLIYREPEIGLRLLSLIKSNLEKANKRIMNK